MVLTSTIDLMQLAAAALAVVRSYELPAMSLAAAVIGTEDGERELSA